MLVEASGNVRMEIGFLPNGWALRSSLSIWIRVARHSSFGFNDYEKSF
jgi:hypothetical protein